MITNPINKKKCGKCRQDKDIVLFSRDGSNSDGLSNTCKECKHKYDVNKRLIANGGISKKIQPEIPEDRFREIAATCTTQAEICKKTGLCSATVCKFVNRYGITFPSRLPTKEQLVEDINFKLSQYNIAEKYGLDVKTIRNLYKKFDIRIDPEVTRQQLSESTRSLWQDPKYREMMCEASREKWKNPEYRAKLTKHLFNLHSNMPLTFTRPHKKVCEILDSLNVEYQIEYPLGPYHFDIFIPSRNILIEVQGTFWHGDNKAVVTNIKNDKAKSTYVKEYFPQHKLYYIWEHECTEFGKIEAKLEYWLGLTKIELIDYSFEHIKIKQVDRDIADVFLYNWHYLHAGSCGMNIGGFLNGELICLGKFISSTRNESATKLGYKTREVLELARLVVHPKYQKHNLLSWFLARCERIIRKSRPEIKCLVSFADSTFNHSGAVYKASNWTLIDTIPPDYFYLSDNGTGWIMHKKTLWDHSKRMGVSEEDFAIKYGYIKIWGREKYKFIRKLK